MPKQDIAKAIRVFAAQADSRGREMSVEATIQALEKLEKYWRTRVAAPGKHAGGAMAARRSRSCRELADRMRKELIQGSGD